MKKPRRIILTINGGVGKNIIATTLTHSLRHANPDAEIIVTSPYVAAWENNPDITKAVDLEKTPTFYRDFVKGADAMILKSEPYWSEDFLLKRRHLSYIWHDMYGIKNIAKKPIVVITEKERSAVAKKLPEGKLFFIQTNGGANNQKYPVSWARDLPLEIAQKVVDTMNKAGYKTIHLRREDQPKLENVSTPKLSLREFIVAVSLSDKRLFIDSLAQHVAAALDLPSTVLWISNSPKIFGYEIHTNIQTTAEPAFRHYMDSYLERDDITGAIHQYPYDTLEIFNVDEILDSLLKS